MRVTKTSLIVGLLALALATACANSAARRQAAEQADARMTSVESAVEANERRLSDLASETDRRLSAVGDEARSAAEKSERAISRADAAAAEAEIAARGRLLWSITLTDANARFPLNGAELTGDAKSALDGLIREIKSLGRAVYLEIEGHTDSTGSEDHNVALGERRAMAVRDYLHRAGGIPLHAMNTISLGETMPDADNSTREGRAQNRRVVVKVLE